MIDPTEFEQFARALLMKSGASADDAEVIAAQILWSSLRGRDSHGAGQLFWDVSMHLGEHPGASVQRTGGVDASAQIPRTPPTNAAGSFEVKAESPSTVVIDGNGCAGQPVTLHGATMAVRKAKDTGVGAVAISNIAYNGSLGFYAEKIASHDCIGIVMTSSRAQSPPFGGTERMLGTNPIAVGVPAGDELPIIIDMATSAVSALDVMNLILTGAPLPAGALLDDAGQPTTDAADYTWGAATEQRGSIANLSGNHKGYAIQLAVELIAGLLAGFATGNDYVSRNRVSTFILAIAVGAFQDEEEFKRLVDERIRQIRSSRPAAGVSEVRVPGQNGFAKEADRRANGIPMDNVYWERVENLARRLDVELPRDLSSEQRG